jgi:Retroviral aspartyl protease
MGSCINKDFVTQNKLAVQPLPIKMPVYNANSTLNANGSIEGFTEVQMIIGDHAEQIELAVTNLGKTDIFLGLDWLCFHNPSIDWTKSLIAFDRCPDKCGYHPWWSSPEE